MPKRDHMNVAGSVAVRVALISASIAGFLCTAEAAEVSLHHLKGALYVAEDTFHAPENSIIHMGTEGVTVIGATWTPRTAELLAAEIAKITDRPVVAIVNTNYHPDRAGGNAYWKRIGARIISTTLTRELLQREWISIVAWTHAAIADFPDVPLALPDETHEGGFELQQGKIRAIYLGPSHTPDGIFVYFPDEKVLYGGCIVKEQLGNLTFANLEEYPKTLRKLQQLGLDIDIVVAGHGKPVHGPELIEHYLTLLRDRH